MQEDPVVAEVHRARQKMAAECNFDIATFFANLRKRQVSLGTRLVTQKTPNKTLQPTSTAIPATQNSTLPPAVPTAEL